MRPEFYWNDPNFDPARNDGIFLNGEDMLQYPPNEMIAVQYGDEGKEVKNERDTLLPDEKIGFFHFTAQSEEEADAMIEAWKKHRERYRKVWDRGKEQQDILKSYFDLNVHSWAEYRKKKAVENEKVSWKDIVDHPEKYKGDLLIQDKSWADGIDVLAGSLMIDLGGDWYENPLVFDFDDMDSFLICALIFLNEEKIKLSDEQREQIIQKLQAKTGDFTRKVSQGHSSR